MPNPKPVYPGAFPDPSIRFALHRLLMLGMTCARPRLCATQTNVMRAIDLCGLNWTLRHPARRRRSRNSLDAKHLQRRPATPNRRNSVWRQT